MNSIQKTIAFLLLLFSIYGNSCNDQHKKVSSKPSEEITFIQDTLQKKEIDSLVAQINEAVRLQPDPFKIPFPVYNEKDTIKYWIRNGETSLVSVTISYPDRVIWPMFYVKNGELVFVRYRYWAQSYPSFAMENMIYLNANKIVYCLERKIELKNGDMPGLLREKDFSNCSSPQSNIKDVYEKYWANIKPLLPNQASSTN